MANSQGLLLPTVQGLWWTTSGSQYLGLNSDSNAGQFFGGDSLTFTFNGAVRAFGLYVITGSGTLADDLGLSGDGLSVFNVEAPALEDFHGSFAYFLGLVSDTDFSSITLNIGEFVLVSAVDDVTLFGAGDNGGGGDVPEPGTLALIGLAVLAAGVARRRQAKSAISFNPGSMA
jgi:hypothetical protein